jgi:hypothetical protein
MVYARSLGSELLGNRCCLNDSGSIGDGDEERQDGS